MLISRFTDDLKKSLRSGVSWDFKLALYPLTLTALLDALWVMYNVGYLDGVTSASIQQISGGDPILDVNGRIAIALTGAVIGLWSRSVVGFLISFLALAYIGSEYIIWYQDSVRALKMMDMESWADFQDPAFPYMGKLRGATWWNIVVLVITVVLLAWHIKLLLSVFKSAKSNLS